MHTSYGGRTPDPSVTGKSLEEVSESMRKRVAWCPAEIIQDYEKDKEGNVKYETIRDKGKVVNRLPVVNRVSVKNAVLGKVEIRGPDTYEYYDNRRKRKVVTGKAQFPRKYAQLKAEVGKRNAQPKHDALHDAGGRTRLMNSHVEKNTAKPDLIRDQAGNVIGTSALDLDEHADMRFFSHGRMLSVGRISKFERDLADAIAEASVIVEKRSTHSAP